MVSVSNWLAKRTLKAGKLNERVLRVFMGTGNEEVLAIIAALKIKIDLSPIVPTRKSLVFFYLYLKVNKHFILVCWEFGIFHLLQDVMRNLEWTGVDASWLMMAMSGVWKLDPMCWKVGSKLYFSDYLVGNNSVDNWKYIDRLKVCFFFFLWLCVNILMEGVKFI